METEYRDQMCHYIKQILQSPGPILWSWGAEKYRHTEYQEMPALKFKVNGFLHKDDVVVAYNGGADCFEVYCLDKSEVVVRRKDDVYLDELIRVIDSMVEKDCSQAQYNAQIKEWGVKSI